MWLKFDFFQIAKLSDTFLRSRVMLIEDEYAPGETSRWKDVSARFPALYKALLAEPDETVRSSMFKTAVSVAG